MQIASHHDVELTKIWKFISGDKPLIECAEVC
jgi:hypothetical protein